MSDFRITSAADFSATTITVEPVTESGRIAFRDHFRAGMAISCTMKKSGGLEFAEAVKDLGLTIS